MPDNRVALNDDVVAAIAAHRKRLGLAPPPPVDPALLEAVDWHDDIDGPNAELADSENMFERRRRIENRELSDKRAQRAGLPSGMAPEK